MHVQTIAHNTRKCQTDCANSPTQPRRHTTPTVAAAAHLQGNRRQVVVSDGVNLTPIGDNDDNQIELRTVTPRGDLAIIGLGDTGLIINGNPFRRINRSS
jgi:hypothetical protein